jgi:hypothetical protein
MYLLFMQAVEIWVQAMIAGVICWAAYLVYKML